MEPIIIVQGGAGSYDRIKDSGAGAQIIEGCKAASISGYRILTTSGSAIDAVVAAVRSLEDNKLFNAGKGSQFTLNEDIEMDASVMDGATLKTGGVTCVKTIKNPVKLAQLVMEQCRAVLLAGEGAEELAKKIPDKITIVENDYFKTNYAKSRLEGYLKEKEKTSDVTMTNIIKDAGCSDTVGAVALDCHGNLAYATSTGGIVGKEPGRVGDSPIVGSGGYADNKVGAVSTTGVGEGILKVNLAKHIHNLMEEGKSAQEASEMSVRYMAKRVQGYAGVITLSKSGDTGIYFNSGGMLWTMIKDNVLKWGISCGEENIQLL